MSRKAMPTDEMGRSAQARSEPLTNSEIRDALEWLDFECERDYFGAHHARTLKTLILSQRCGRDEGIEEAAKICEHYAVESYSNEGFNDFNAAAKRIRSLVSDDKERGSRA